MSKGFKFVLKLLYSGVSLYLFLRYGFMVEAMIATIIQHVQLGTELSVVLREPQFAHLMLYIITVFYSGFVFSNSLEDIFFRIQRWLFETKEEQDTKDFIRWIKKEQKRLRKLEKGTL